MPFLSSLAVIFALLPLPWGRLAHPRSECIFRVFRMGLRSIPSRRTPGDSITSIGCMTKSDNGEIRITDWRGAAEQSVAGAPAEAARPPMVLRLQGDPEMLNFQVGHEVRGRRSHRGR